VPEPLTDDQILHLVPYPKDWLVFARAIERAVLGARRDWSAVAVHGSPQCDGEQVYIGINSAGFAACFNWINPDGLCVMGGPESSTAQMSELCYWRELDWPSGSGVSECATESTSKAPGGAGRET
jgi:hypothetical protein